MFRDALTSSTSWVSESPHVLRRPCQLSQQIHAMLCNAILGQSQWSCRIISQCAPLFSPVLRQAEFTLKSDSWRLNGDAPLQLDDCDSYMCLSQFKAIGNRNSSDGARMFVSAGMRGWGKKAQQSLKKVPKMLSGDLQQRYIVFW